MDEISIKLERSCGSLDEIAEIHFTLIELFDKLGEYEKKVERTGSLAAIGQSTAMIAHDVRKPLASVKALLTALPSLKGNPQQVSRMISEVDRNIAQTNAMLNDVLEFSRDSTALELKELNPQGVVTSALVDALRIHGDVRVAIHYNFGHTRSLMADGGRIIRVLTNLFDNSLGALSATLKNAATGNFQIGTKEVEKDGRLYIAISVADDGPGIPAEIIGKIFDPFFTHGKKGGTGLGLSICRRIVEMHNGTLTAGNREDGTGAVITMTLPAGTERVGINEAELIRDSDELKMFREEEAVRPEYGSTENTAEFLRINKERGRMSYLMLVDDEPLFRETVRGLLDNMVEIRDHVRIVEAESAETALKIFDAREFDYVVADIDLGKGRMNGYEFAQLVLEKHPDASVLIHSNKRKDELDKNVRRINSDRFMGFLPKPMRASELLQFLACKSFEAAAVPPAAATEPKKSILLVNDDENFNIAMRMTLKAMGAQVMDATNVSDAMKHIVDHRFDIILSDINLGKGEKDGYDFLQEVRGKDTSIPFYFMSGYSKADVWERAESMGATGYLQVPADNDELNQLLKTS